MNKIIYLTGTVDSSFFNNEIDYLIKYFDEVIVISYSGDNNKLSNLSKSKEFKHYIIKKSSLKSLFDIELYKWLLSKNTIDEIKENFTISKQGLLKLLYTLSYGLFFIKSKKVIDHLLLINNKDNISLYSFWLTRSAYTIANYNNRMSNVKNIVSRAHGYDLYEERNPLNYLPFRGFINKNLDEIHFISNNGLNYFLNKYGSDELYSKKNISRLGTFNYGVIRKKIEQKNFICIASCSSIISVKRLDLIIDVLANINVPTKWIHLGTGKQKREIEAYAADKLKDKDYHFLGQVDNSEILKTYMEYDVDFFINMSDSEGVPVSMMEAMSMGIPVIARNVGGISEIVSEKTGLLIEDISNSELVFNKVNQEIRSRIEDLSTYQNKLHECLNLWNEKYDANKNYNIFFSSLVK